MIEFQGELMIEKDFDDTIFDLMSSGISEFSSQERSARIQIGDVFGSYEVLAVYQSVNGKEGRVDVVCLECGNNNNVSRSRLTRRGCPHCAKQRASEKLIQTLKPGEQYHSLLVVEESKYVETTTGRRSHRVKCVCTNCNSKEVREYEVSHVRAGNSKSCGCISKEKCRSRGLNIDVGKKYGRLTVLGEDNETVNPNGKKRRRFWVQCDCGQKFSTYSWTLTNAVETTSCKECAKAQRALSLKGKKRKSGGIGSRVPVEVQQQRKRDWKRNKERELRQDPTYRAITSIRKKTSKVIKGGNPNKHCFGTSRQKFLRHIESQFRDGMTWENYGDYWHVDHIFPITKASEVDALEKTAATNWRNLRPMIGADNMSKNDFISETVWILWHYIKAAVEYEMKHRKVYVISFHSWLEKQDIKSLEMSYKQTQERVQ
jgi:hypothetical protein